MENRPYTKHDEQYICDAFGVLHNNEVAERLGRTPYAIRQKQKKLGLNTRTKKPVESDIDLDHRWTEAWIADLDHQRNELRARLKAEYTVEVEKELTKAEDDLMVLTTLLYKLPEKPVAHAQHDTWLGLLKSLEDDENRRQLGREIALMKLAADKKRKEMTEYHDYMDGKLDHPLLNVDVAREYGELDDDCQSD